MIVPAKPQQSRSPYPDSDGQPMADNTLQFEWIGLLKGGCDALFADRPDVFVAGDHLIYPVEAEEGEEDEAVRIAPDVYVAFGRPKGHRGSYRVWEEDGVFPQVVFEVWSPGNRQQQMEDKREAYERYGAEEYYIIYPEFPAFVEGWVRAGTVLSRIPDIKAWVSPRLGIRFELRRGHLTIRRPDGGKFLSYLELCRAADEAAQATDLARQAADRAEEAANRAAAARERAESAEQRAERLAAKLRELGLDPDAG